MAKLMKTNRLRYLGLAMLWGFFASNVSNSTLAAAAKPDCEAEFMQMMESVDRYPDLLSRIKRMEAFGPQCKGTGIYEARLGELYTKAGRYEDARTAIQSGIAMQTLYQRNLRLALSDIDFRQGKLMESEAQAVTLIRDFPEWSGGYIALGETRLAQRRFQEGIDSLERANALEPNSGTYTLLAMAYYQVDRPKDSAISMQKALKLDKAALKHTQAVCATAYSLVALDHLPEAEDLLVKHLKVQPSAANDPTYQAASSLVKKKIQEQN